jgi:hypothetical protein
MMIRNLSLILVMIAMTACGSSAKKAVENLMNELPKEKALDKSKYQTADDSLELMKLPAGSVINLLAAFYVSNQAEYDGGGNGVFIQNGFHISNEAVATIDSSGIGEYCILTTKTSDKTTLFPDEWFDVQQQQIKIQPTSGSSFIGIQMQLSNEFYTGLFLRGQTVGKLINDCFGKKVEVLVPIK